MKWLAAALTASIMAGPVVAAPTARDWSQVAARKPDGAFVQGNPAARVRLVEYLSFTCPHCAVMEAKAIPPLTEKYIRTGLVSYEVRHALRDAFDFSASLMARCAGPRAFFAVAPAVYADQQAWFTRAATWSQTAPTSLTPEKAIAAAAQGAGLDKLFAAHGLPETKQATCIADPAERKLLSDMANEAWNRPNFPGTPAFLINGVQMDNIGSWTDLDQKLATVLKK